MHESLTLEQRAANHATWRHIQRVQHYLHVVIRDLLNRAEQHDQTKLDHPEVDAYASPDLPGLSSLTFGSPEYESAKKDILGEALAHHYANNRHHPEFFKHGMDDMNLVDLIELYVDWKAASERHSDGNLRHSIDINAVKYGLSPQLKRIFENTIDVLGS